MRNVIHAFNRGTKTDFHALRPSKKKLPYSYDRHNNHLLSELHNYASDLVCLVGIFNGKISIYTFYCICIRTGVGDKKIDFTYCLIRWAYLLFSLYGMLCQTSKILLHLKIINVVVNNCAYYC